MQASRVVNVWEDPSIVVDDETAKNYAHRELGGTFLSHCFLDSIFHPVGDDPVAQRDARPWRV